VSGAEGTIEVPAAEVVALGARLGAQAGLAGEVATRLDGLPTVGGPLQPALSEFLTCHRAAAHALAGELDWLGVTITAVAGSWLNLDGSLLPSSGRAVPR
jgi:hypothetical protein